MRVGPLSSPGAKVGIALISTEGLRLPMRTTNTTNKTTRSALP